MEIIELEDKIVEIVNREKHSYFLYELLDAYNIPRATITRLKKGNQNMTKRDGEVHLKNKVWFKEVNKGKLFDGYVEVERQVAELSAKPRYILVTDFSGLLAKDTKTEEALDINFDELPKHFDFFLAWKGIERAEYEKENPADIKAAERFARLYDVLSKENNEIDLFLVRLLFCLFAEDTGIFPRISFTNAVKTLTREDGKDLNLFFKKAFEVMDMNESRRPSDIPEYLKQFPYVNGQLFKEPHRDLVFSKKSRKLIVEAGELLDWSKINPDIFGSMIQAVATEDSRSHLGMHYTSVPNIMKVIKPLFLDKLKQAYIDAYDDGKKLEELLTRISKIKFFDPACGSGNFLIITYKEMRRLEIKIIKRLQELLGSYLYVPSITLSQFYGIEIDEFAHDVARLSLWIADHQMNEELNNEVHNAVRPTLPLRTAGFICCKNALQTDWNQVCPHEKDDEVYLFGNPPYLGAKKQNKEHKQHLETIFSDVKNYKMLDYISGWFFLGSKYITESNAQLAFVSTNSISQGEQVSILWPLLFAQKVEISFAHKSFKWNNNAKNNAGVTVVVIGLNAKIIVKKQKKLFLENSVQMVDNITPYLTQGSNILVYSSKVSISNLPKLNFGNMPNDGGHLILTKEEYPEFLLKNSGAEKFIRKFVGSVEFIQGNYRYCIWIEPNEVTEAMKYPSIKKRVEKVWETRLNSKRSSTKKLAEKPYSFGEVRHQNMDAIVIPAVSSENRFYIPMGIVSSKTILSNRVYAIYGADIYILGVLMSRMHMTWVKAVGGRLKTDYNYSAGLCYNTFPLPELSTRRKNEIKEAVLEIIDTREEKGDTLAELYNPKTMPMDLIEAHDKLDRIVDRAYRQKAFETDMERLEVLLRMYQELTEG
ncbi:class I SAM-dependent DNA methyltransferase [Virgibacillus siamensis]|uniref:class I SAM-dependent DNA methyltransferase n=1 Tax=Virgibacillus siamensis TaxID=480071 RepID=UPI000985C4D6|nr:DNA methyltransferase [Virgibacillus siamensis]